jgi:PST family polysaccharide transporter
LVQEAGLVGVVDAAPPTFETMTTLIETEPSGSDNDPALEGQIAPALRWSFASQIIGRVVSVASGIVLARILIPDDFGTFAVALLVVNILFGLNDLGMLLAVVRFPGDLRHGASTASTLAIGSSVLLYAVCFVAAPSFASAMNSPDSAGILRVLSLTILIDGVTTVPNGLLHRAFRQDRLAVAEFSAMPVGVAVTVGMAAAGFGAWSLAIGQVCGNLMSRAMMLYFSPFVPRPGFDVAVARQMLSFGIPLALTSLLEYSLLNADYVVVGGSLGPALLGLYLLAYNISGWPVTILTDAIRRVSIVGFARLDTDDPASLIKSFERTFVLLVTLAVPVSLGLALLASELVNVVYGDRWAGAAEVLRFLAVLGCVRVAVGYVFDLLIGTGRSTTTLWLKGVWLVVLVPALIVGAHVDSIRGVAIAHLLVGVLVALPLFLLAAVRVGVDPLLLRRASVRPAIGAVLAGVTGWFLHSVLSGDVVRLVVAGPAIALVYCAVALPVAAIRERGPAALLTELGTDR